MEIDPERAQNQDALTIIAMHVIGSVFAGAAEIMEQAAKGKPGVATMELNFTADTMARFKRMAGLVARILGEESGPVAEPLPVEFWEALDAEGGDEILLRVAVESQQYDALFDLLGQNQPNDN